MNYLNLNSKTELTETEKQDAISDIKDMIERGYKKDQAICHIAICYDVNSFYLADIFQK